MVFVIASFNFLIFEKRRQVVDHYSRKMPFNTDLVHDFVPEAEVDDLIVTGSVVVVKTSLSWVVGWCDGPG